MSDTETDKLVNQWEGSGKDVERLKSELNSAECAFRNATTALAKHLTPDDAEDGEKFSIWHYGRLLEVSHNKNRGTHSVTVRRKKIT